jgi:hypothetical protein
MSTQKQSQAEGTSGRRTLINILGFMLGTIALLVLLKYLMGM